jgi:capsular polysaccharide biosynthesis protein
MWILQNILRAFLFGLMMGAALIIDSYSFDEFIHESLIPWLSKKLDS